MQEAKEKIETLTEEYKKVFPQDYENVKEYVKLIKANMIDEDFGEIKGEHAVERRLFELPELLYASLVKSLSDKHLKWFKTKTGHRWFARRYGEFKVVNKV